MLLDKSAFLLFYNRVWTYQRLTELSPKRVEKHKNEVEELLDDKHRISVRTEHIVFLERHFVRVHYLLVATECSH